MRWWLWFFWGLAARLSAGCRHALSPAVRQQIDTTLSFTQLHTTPAAYKDRIVMLGGDIFSTRNLTQGTLSKCCKNRWMPRTDRLTWIGPKGGSWRFVRVSRPGGLCCVVNSMARPHAQLPSSMDRCTAQAQEACVKITAVQAYPLSLPRLQPSWTAHEISSEATLILVEVQTDAGLRGYGEIQSGPLPLVCRLVEQFGEIIRGMDALAHLEVWEKLSR